MIRFLLLLVLCATGAFANAHFCNVFVQNGPIWLYLFSGLGGAILNVWMASLYCNQKIKDSLAALQRYKR